MEIKKILSWNIRASMVYAVGVWTMVGSYFYFKYTGKYDQPESAKAQPPVVKEANPNEVIYKTPHSTTVITYKEGFVPFRTRITNIINSFTGEDATGDNNGSK